MMRTEKSLAILGAGAFGTALAISLGNNQQTVTLWDRNVEKLHHLRKSRLHPHLGLITLPASIHIETTLHKALACVRDILIAVPSQGFRELLLTLKPLITAEHRIAWVTKGFEAHTGHLLHNLVFEILGTRPIAVLSGPSFALEVARGLPTAVVIASNNQDFSADLMNRFNNAHFRTYANPDIIGVELGGAVKNVLAIATGMSDGLGFGANARAALITRGIAEMQQLYTALGAESSTLLSLAGIGDLILTCTDDQSRNRRLGFMMGQGLSLAKAKENIGQSVEGVYAAHEIYGLIQKHALFMPICEQVFHLVTHTTTPQQAAQKLLVRDVKKEF